MPFWQACHRGDQAAVARSIIVLGVSIFYSNPVVMTERDPGLIDWVEDLLFTGLLFLAAGLLTYQVAGYSLVP